MAVTTHNDSHVKPSKRWPRVSVVISARDAEKTIGETLDSVLDQKYPGDLEVIVGDGSEGSTTSELIRM